MLMDVRSPSAIVSQRECSKVSGVRLCHVVSLPYLPGSECVRDTVPETSGGRNCREMGCQLADFFPASDT